MRSTATFIAAAALVLSHAATFTAAQQPRPEHDATGARFGPQRRAADRFERQGVRPGQTIEPITVHTLQGETTPLNQLWRERPALIVTASLTCPVARERCPMLQPIIDRFGEQINVAMLYSIEAHPTGGDSPYRPGRGEWITPQNQRAGVLHPQPASLDERLKLARNLHERLGGIATMLVDGMDNRAWKHLGAGPNLAVLVRADGVVEAKHGWFDPELMENSIAALLRRASQFPDADSNSLFSRMQAFLDALRRDDAAELQKFYAKDARIWFGARAGEGQLIAESPWREWDLELRAAHEIEDARFDARALTVVSHEQNDYSRLLDFGGWRATITYAFNDDGLVTEKLYVPMEQSPTQRECFAPALDWAREHRADELEEIFAGDRLTPSRDHARRWRALLIEWRKATGRPTIPLK